MTTHTFSPAASEAVLLASHLRLPVIGATATGVTALSAFHRALVRCGLGHYNLVRLSSVIPPGVEVAPGSAGSVKGGWGDRLYCVYAEQRASTAGQEAWAGVGWVQRRDGGGGFLVEHEGVCEAAVTAAVRNSLNDMVADQEHEFTSPQWVVTGMRCETQPVCALVIVPYVTALWEPQPQMP